MKHSEPMKNVSAVARSPAASTYHGSAPSAKRIEPTLNSRTIDRSRRRPLADALDTLQAERGLDIDIHVDGASGAFLAPFCAPELEWDFRLPRVKSISTSGHKFGLAPLGVGWVVWRDAAELPDDLIFHVSYLGGDMPVFQINFSRPAGQIAAQYYDFVRLGREGYRRVHMASYDASRDPGGALDNRLHSRQVAAIDAAGPIAAAQARVERLTREEAAHDRHDR